MWQKPWGYKEGFVICTGLFATGTLLQQILGPLSLDTLAYPVNILAGTIYILLLVALYLFFRKSALVRWMGSVQAAVTSLIGLLIPILLMGLIRQKHGGEIGGDWLGFSDMLSAVSFALLFLWMMSVLFITVLKRISRFCWADFSFMLNHLGLFIAVFGAVLGSADMKRGKMTVTAGKVEWRMIDEEGHLIELPLAIELEDFTIDEYPPKLMLIDNRTGKALPQGKPDHVLLEEETQQAKLGEWVISVTDKLPMAASYAFEDTLKFVEFHSLGATDAVYVKAQNERTHSVCEGWVSCGSFLFPYKALRLDEMVSLVMPSREPKRFASDVWVYTQAGTTDSATIEVNKPLEIGGWKIYQLSYDESKGRWSDVSIFELIRDPWLPVVYAGIWMMIVGAVCMFSIVQKRKEKK